MRKKKYAKGMITLFQKYKEKGLTSDEIRQKTRTKSNIQPEAIISTVGGIKTKLERLDTSDWDETYRLQLSKQLTELKQLIDEKLGLLAT